MNQAIITGASKGLGKALAFELAQRGYEVLLIARSADLLQPITADITKKYQSKAYFLAVDLTQQQAIEKIKDWCSSQDFHPSVLINNAGFACWGYFDKLPLNRQLELLQLNILCGVALTHAMLPSLKKQRKSYILNVCSTAAYQAVPTMTLYAASKSFVRSFSRGLRFELRKSNVSVTCLSPGPIASNFIEAANMQAMQEDAKKLEMTPEDVAHHGLEGMFKGKAEVIPGLINASSVILSKIVPDLLLEKIANKIYESKLGKPH
jgi:short-subunit dehydrogenase